MRLNEEKLKKLSKSKGLGLKALLAAAEISPTAYYSLVQKQSVLPKSILKLASFLEVPPGDLLFDEQQLINERLQLEREADRIVARNKKANRQDILHTLLLLKQEPIERLNRALLRGRKFNFHK